MKANHNRRLDAHMADVAVPNISKSKNESKSQPHGAIPPLQRAVPNISKSKNESKSQPSHPYKFLGDCCA